MKCHRLYTFPELSTNDLITYLCVSVNVPYLLPSSHVNFVYLVWNIVDSGPTKLHP